MLYLPVSWMQNHWFVLLSFLKYKLEIISLSISEFLMIFKQNITTVIYTIARRGEILLYVEIRIRI